MDREAPRPLHLEITSRCALACPACPRTEGRGNYSVTDLGLETIRRLRMGGSAYTCVLVCGNHGDPIYHPHFHDVLAELLLFDGHPPIRIATNGSHRDRDWWRKTAEILRPQDLVVFGLDGLADTSKLYRRGSDWNSAIEGIRALKEFGVCQVDWQWILFRHNQDQLPQARRLSEELKIDCFRIIRSFRGSDGDPTNPTITLEEARARFDEANSSAL